MLNSFLNKLFHKPASEQQIISAYAAPQLSIADIPRYPPFDKGMPAVSVDQIVESQAQLIGRIKAAFGIPAAEYEDRVLRVIRNFAAYVHLLPATKDSYHRGAGGLFRLGLEIGFFSLQASDGAMFSSRDTAEQRRRLQPKWAYATFLAGLCSEIYRPVTSMVVVDKDGNAWPQFIMPLGTWAQQNKIDRYFIRWLEGGDADVAQQHANAAYLLNAIIPMDCLQFLNTESAQIITAMTSSITGSSRQGSKNMIHQFVTQAQNKVTAKDVKSNSHNYGNYMVGVHLEPHLISAMRALVENQTWKVNTKGGRIWTSEEGVFLVWGAAAKEIIAYLASLKLDGIPNNIDTLADIMVDARIIEPAYDGAIYWRITIPKIEKHVDAVKIAHKDILPLEDLIFEPLDAPLLHAVVEKQPEQIVRVNQSQVESRESIQEGAGSAADPENSVTAAVLPDPEEVEQPSKSSQTPQQITTVEGTKVEASKHRPHAQEETKPKDAINRAMEALSESSRQLLLAIREDYLSGETEHDVWECEHGIAISLNEFRSHGVNEVNVIKELIQKNWLVPDTGSHRKFMSLPRPQGTGKIEAYVINVQAANALGFGWGRKAKGSPK